MMLEDISGKPVSAMHVFSLSIKALTSHLIDQLAKQGTGIHDDEIRWVLTVPAIWTDSAKQFMRRSANEVYFFILPSNYCKKTIRELCVICLIKSLLNLSAGEKRLSVAFPIIGDCMHPWF